MTDTTRVVDLPELNETPADDDVVHMVDVSDDTYTDGTSKKVTIANLVGGKAASGANSDITSLSGLTTPLSVAQGGTGATTHTSGGVLVGAGTSAPTSSKAAPTGDFVGTTDTQTLTNKTLTTPTVTSPVLNTGVSGSAVLDEDNMASDSATQLATQQSIKAYVDNSLPSRSSGVTAGSTSSPTTTSTTYADMTDMSVSISTNASASVLVVVSSAISNTNSSLNYVALNVDGGSEVGEIRTGLNNSTGNITTSYLFTGLSAASHTFKARWKTSAGTLTAVTTNRTITAIEI